MISFSVGLLISNLSNFTPYFVEMDSEELYVSIEKTFVLSLYTALNVTRSNLERGAPLKTDGSSTEVICEVNDPSK
jgi:hypothetical protein